MKKIRVLPYGYEYKDGIISNKEEEYIVVREIFNSYCKGNSLLKIAQFLNQRKIEYQPGTVTYLYGQFFIWLLLCRIYWEISSGCKISPFS